MMKIDNMLKNTFQVVKLLFLKAPRLLLIIFCSSLIGAVSPFVNYVSSLLIINALIGQAEISRLFMLAAFTILANMGILLILRALVSLKGILTYKLDVDFDKLVCEKMLDLEYKVLEAAEVRELKRSIDQSKMWRGGITRAVSLFEEIVKSVFVLLLAIVSFIGIFQLSNRSVPSFWTSAWPMVILLFTVLAFTLWNTYKQFKNNARIVDLFQRIQTSNAGAMAFMGMISDYRFGKDIRVYALKPLLCDYIDYMRTSQEGLRLFRQLSMTRGMLPSINAAVNVFFSAAAYLLAAMKVIHKEISAGSIVLYAGSITQFTSAVSKLMLSSGEFVECCNLLLPYLQLMQLRVERDKEEDKLPQPHLEHKIEFKNVSFKYPNSQKYALRHLSFTIIPGDRVAVVGMNASGKSTMIKLLCRLYEPDEGEILLDGINIQNYELQEYQKLFGIVFQDYMLMSLPIGQNIACKEQYDILRVKNALDKAGILDHIDALPDQLDSALYQDFDENGIEISSGEAQKLAIARALYKDSPFLVFDEPTATLDPRAESEVYNFINHKINDKTVVFVSHRLSSCQFCNTILVFHEGKLVQQGSHDQLLKEAGGKYSELWNAQAQFYK